MQTNLLQLSKIKNYFRTIKNASHNKILVKYNIYIKICTRIKDEFHYTVILVKKRL